jgi:hypothetical protein
VGDLAPAPGGHVPFTAVAIDVDGDVQLTPVRGQAASLQQWTTMFHLAVVVVDPFTYESSWILDTARRIMSVFSDADCRVGFIVTGTTDEAKQFLGPLVQEYLVLADPTRAAVKAMGLERLPAFVHLNQNHAIESRAEGWNPDEWRAAAERLALLMDWRRPQIPAASDPVPFEGTPALG